MTIWAKSCIHFLNRIKERVPRPWTLGGDEKPSEKRWYEGIKGRMAKDFSKGFAEWL